jgi:hypothetical protein
MLEPRAIIVVSVIVGILTFLTLVFLLQISVKSAEDIGVLTVGVVLAYMMLFYFIMNVNNVNSVTPVPT